jgi:acetyl-CoA carboxylase carboxyltransferase component
MEGLEMQDELKRKIEEMAKRFKAPREFIEASQNLKQATTVQAKLEAFNKEKDLIEQGNREAVKKQHDCGKLTARERVATLLDPGSFEELDLWHRPYETGFDIGEEIGRGDGVVVGYGAVNGRSVTVWAQDSTVMGGTVGTVHARKVNMIMENALNAKTPIVAIFDSEGLRVHDVIQYPEFYSTSTMARFQTMASGVIPKISLVMGSCRSDMAIIAALGDFVFMVKNTSHMHLMPPPSGSTCQEIGDSLNVHARLSGCCDVIAGNDDECLLKCRQLLSYLPTNNMEKPPIVKTGDDPNRREGELLELVPVNSSKPYSMYRLISLVVDQGDLFEIRRSWARNLITGFARLDGHTVGIIANNPQDRAGCMTLDAADKMSHFVRFCDAFNIPCIWLADTPAFLPAVDEERRGLIRHGSGMLLANTEATVPRITVFIRKAYGGGRLAMPGQFLTGDLQVAWPTYEPGLMGAEGAVSIIYRKELMDIRDEKAREEQKKKRVEEMQLGLDMLLRESTQTFIDPRDTRPFLIGALKWLENRQKDYPPKKHENIRL